MLYIYTYTYVQEVYSKHVAVWQDVNSTRLKIYVCGLYVQGDSGHAPSLLTYWQHVSGSMSCRDLTIWNGLEGN